MKLQCIHYENFRNHRLLNFEPSDGISILYGPNASGKTSILEGVHYCALTRGFHNALDSECLYFSSDFFVLESSFLDATERATTVRVLYTKEKEKKIIVDKSEIKPFSRHIGRIPCITFSPVELVIVNGAPAERRRFLDNAICQTNRRYLDDLLAYKRVLQQRNALIGQMYEKTGSKKEMLAIWTDSLSRLAASIVYARMQFLSSFLPLFQTLYQLLSPNEHPTIVYRCSLGKVFHDSSVDKLYSQFLVKFEKTEREEILRGQTMTGPHRDDLLFLLHTREIKKYASQGQMRIFLIALKLSQHRLFSDILGEKPICLLDDLFSELDASHSNAIFRLLETCGQTIITSAENKPYSHVDSISIESLKGIKEM